MPHWKGKDIHIVSEPSQGVQADGELIGNSPVHIQVLPAAIKVIIPPESPIATDENTQAVSDEKKTA
jgi:diacylglycerol kinase family enzyme